VLSQAGRDAPAVADRDARLLGPAATGVSTPGQGQVNARCRRARCLGQRS
jgi:hypothetical protein